MMSDDLLVTIVEIALLILPGFLLVALDRRSRSMGWLLIAAALLFTHDFLLLNGFGLLPRIDSGFERNWQGKSLALLFVIAVASLPAFGWRRCGFTLAQKPEGQVLTYAICTVFIVATALWAATGDASAASTETFAFQLTMPGLEEEAFFRGLLLFCLAKAFPTKTRFAGVPFGWGDVLVVVLFGFVHGFYFNGNLPAMDWWLMLNTGTTGFLLLWVRLRTGSVVLPIILHNVGNTLPLVVSGWL